MSLYFYVISIFRTDQINIKRVGHPVEKARVGEGNFILTFKFDGPNFKIVGRRIFLNIFFYVEDFNF